MNGLPIWYQLSPPDEDMEITVENWKLYAIDRFNKLVSKTSWFPSNDSVYQFLRDSYDKDKLDELNLLINNRDFLEKEKRIQEIGGHLLLRSAAFQNERSAAWLVEEEGDLFAYRLKYANFAEMFSIAQDLLGENNVLDLARFKERFRREQTVINYTERYERRNYNTKKSKSDKLVAVNFAKIPFLVGKRNILLLQGWGILLTSTLSSTLKRSFEVRLREQAELSLHLFAEAPEIKDIVRMISKALQQLTSSSASNFANNDNLSLGDRSLTEAIPYLPPCIRHLLLVLSAKGHIGHSERIQLGTFLKSLGMNVDQQLRFWYDQAVDNIGISFEDFSKRAGYQIRFIYGLEGGKTDYKAPKCTTCISGYYCYFAHTSSEKASGQLNQNLITIQKMNEKNASNTSEKSSAPSSINQDIQLLNPQVLTLIIQNRPQEACAVYLKQLNQYSKLNKVSHMLQFARESFKVLNPS